MLARVLDGKAVLWGLLAIGLVTAVTQAGMLDGLTPTTVVSYDFDSWGRAAGQNWADGVMWGDYNGIGALAQVYNDGGNLCGKILPWTATGTAYHSVYLNQTLLGVMATQPINILSFKVKVQTGQNWDNWDKAVQVKWGQGGTGHHAYGTDIGTGFSIATESGVGKAQGSFGYGTSKAGGSYVAPYHPYHTAMTDANAKATFDNTGWTTLTVAMNRTDGWTEWYRNGVMYASYQVLHTDPESEFDDWIWGSNVAPDPADARSMQWIDVGAWGRYQSTTSSMLLDDFVVAYAPEPASLALLGLAALPLVIRRRRLSAP